MNSRQIRPKRDVGPAEGRSGSAAACCRFDFLRVASKSHHTEVCFGRDGVPRAPWNRSSTCIGLALLALTCCLAPAVSAQGRAECRDAPSKILGHAVPYCVILPPSYDASKTRRYPVLYFLHGLGGNAQTLIDSGGLDMIEDLWQQKQIGEFLIVTPNAGRSFYINSRDGRVRYQDFFIREFLPYIEMHYRVLRDRQHRGISGVSMGGYGALRFGLLYRELFGSVSAHSPALVENPPQANVSNMQEMAITRFLGSAFGVPFDPAYWRRESPFTIVRDGPRPRDLSIYFDCGTSDDFGFNRGAEAFHRLLVARGIPHEFHLYPGGHDWTYFAQHLPASFEFHSHVFFP
jgi:S-formylglutathione hydrolase FrmB